MDRGAWPIFSWYDSIQRQMRLKVCRAQPRRVEARAMALSRFC